MDYADSDDDQEYISPSVDQALIDDDVYPPDSPNGPLVGVPKIEDEDSKKNMLSGNKMSLPLAKSLIVGSVSIPIYKYMDHEDWKHAAVSGVVLGSSVLATGSVISFIPASFLSVLKEYAEPVITALLCSVAKKLISKYSGMVESRGLLREFLIAFGSLLVGGYLEDPIKGYLPSFIS